MTHILGNFYGTVKPWYLPFDWVFARKIGSYGYLKTVIIKNKKVPNVYGLPVIVRNREVYKSLGE